MPVKIAQERWDSLVDEHLKGGRRIFEILKDNPDIKKSTFQGRIKKAKQAAAQVDRPEDPPVDTSDKPKTTITIRPKHPKMDQEDSPVAPPQPPKVAPPPGARPLMAPPTSVRDDFLTSVAPERFRTTGSQQHSNIADSLFSGVDLFGPEAVSKPAPQAAPKSSKPALGKGYSWWTKLPKEDKKKQPLPQLEEDNERLVLVQKIRLYFVHFPELSKLHIVPRMTKKKSDGDKPPAPDVDKFMLSLYDKKVDDLLKIVNLIRFHVRNTINENSSVRLANNMLETSVKVLEHTLFMFGVQSKDLTKSVMADQDIQRCVKEILIDHSITPVNLGPKSDLALKLGMKIVSTDSQNRIDRKLEEIAREQQTAAGKAGDKAEPPQEPKAMSQTLADKYKVL